MIWEKAEPFEELWKKREGEGEREGERDRRGGKERRLVFLDHISSGKSLEMCATLCGWLAMEGEGGEGGKGKGEEVSISLWGFRYEEKGGENEKEVCVRIWTVENFDELSPLPPSSRPSSSFPFPSFPWKKDFSFPLEGGKEAITGLMRGEKEGTRMVKKGIWERGEGGGGKMVVEGEWRVEEALEVTRGLV